ncbi:MAG: hypothetical protein AAF203_00985 [Pseudomonadota bacterium]
MLTPFFRAVCILSITLSSFTANALFSDLIEALTGPSVKTCDVSEIEANLSDYNLVNPIYAMDFEGNFSRNEQARTLGKAAINLHEAQCPNSLDSSEVHYQMKGDYKGLARSFLMVLTCPDGKISVAKLVRDDRDEAGPYDWFDMEKSCVYSSQPAPKREVRTFGAGER